MGSIDNRKLPALVVFFSMIVSTVNGQDMSGFEGTDMTLENLCNIKVVVASKNEENISDAPGVISVITQDQLKRFGGTTLGDVLKRVPSFLGTTVYFTDRSVIASRGDQVMPSSSHILLLINGRPMREVLEGGIKSEVYESFPVAVIDRIEVIRGPGSVLYGSQAFSAVINVITRSADLNSTSVEASLDERLGYHSTATVNYRLGDLGIVLAGRHADRGGWKLNWEAPNSAGRVDVVPVEISDYGPGAYMELSFRNLRIMGSYNEWNNRSFVPDYQIYKGIPFIMPYGDATAKVNWKKIFTDIGYQQEITDWYKTSLNATWTRSMLTTDGFPWTARDAYETLVEETNYFSPTENFNITVGGTWSFMTGREGDSRSNTLPAFNENNTQITLSGYAQVDYRFPWMKIIAGIQANKVENFPIDPNPRFGLIFYPLEHVNVKTLYSTAYRAPSLDELFLNHPTMRGQMVERTAEDIDKTTSLDPEKVHTFDIGANYQDGRTQFGINGFHSQLKNLIFQDRDPTHFAIPTWDNLSDITIFGVECEGRCYLTRELMVEGSFLFQQSRDQNTREENVTPLPNFSMKGGLSYLSSYGLTVSVFNTFHQALDVKYSSELNTTTGFYNMVNIHCSYDFNRLFGTGLKEISLVIDGDNLLNEEVWLPAWGLVNGSRIPYNRGRSVYGGVKISL